MALFLVMASIALLTFLVTEFSYVSQVHSRLSYDYVDSLKAHYAAQTGLKMSLLRLKAFRELSMLAQGEAAAAVPGLNQQVLDSIWSIPFRYPFPKDLPGLSPLFKSEIVKFEKASASDASWDAIISADSNKINLNLLVSGFNLAPSKQKKTTGPDPDAPPPPPPTQPNQPREKPPEFTPEESRKSFRQQIAQIFENKSQLDPYFANKLRLIDQDELVDNLITWVDPQHQGQNRSGKQVVPYKRAPFYHISELRMIYPIDDEVFDIITQVFTVGPKSAININTMQRALIEIVFPALKREDIDEFLIFRDDPQADNRFKKVDSLWEYLGKINSTYRDESLKTVKNDLISRGITLSVSDQRFSINVVGRSRGATRRLEVAITLDDPVPATNRNTRSSDGAPDANIQSDNSQINSNNLPANTYPQLENVPGLRIWFNREW